MLTAVLHTTDWSAGPNYPQAWPAIHSMSSTQRPARVRADRHHATNSGNAHRQSQHAKGKDESANTAPATTQHSSQNYWQCIRKTRVHRENISNRRPYRPRLQPHRRTLARPEPNLPAKNKKRQLSNTSLVPVRSKSLYILH